MPYARPLAMALCLLPVIAVAAQPRAIVRALGIIETLVRERNGT